MLRWVAQSLMSKFSGSPVPGASAWRITAWVLGSARRAKTDSSARASIEATQISKAKNERSEWNEEEDYDGDGFLADEDDEDEFLRGVVCMYIRTYA